MAYAIRRVLNPTEEEIDRGAAALAEAFHHQFFIGGLGGDKTLVTPILRAHITGGLIAGEVYYAELPGKEVVAVAVWFGPGQKFLSSDAQRNAGWNQVMNKLEATYSAWWDYFLNAYDKLCEEALGPGVKLASYHLQVFGTIPEQQRKGIGGALIKTVEDLARPKSIALCLETVGETNVKIYKSMGFGVKGSGSIKSPSGQEFVMYSMLKQM